MYVPLTGGTLQVKWGTVTIGGTSVAITFPAAFANACDQVLFSSSGLDSGGGSMWVTSISTTGCVINSINTVAATIYWIAWGH
jgi:hypothetical protein